MYDNNFDTKTVYAWELYNFLDTINFENNSQVLNFSVQISTLSEILVMFLFLSTYDFAWKIS